MTGFAIRAERLGKRYELGELVSFRDVARQLGRFFSRREQLPREELWALRDISFEVKPGEVVGIIGRNGAGKSTLLKILSRIVEPSEGRATLVGRIGALLEVGTGFHPELSGRDNVYLNGAILGMSRSEIRRKFDDIVAFAEVERFLDTPVKRYSSGMRVRLGFAVAAHLDPEILLVDEVLAVGDSAFQQRCLSKLGTVAQSGRTVFFVSHDLSAVQGLTSRCLLLEGGKLLAEGPTEEVVARYVQLVSRPTAAGDVSTLPRSKARFGSVLRMSAIDPLPGSAGAFAFGAPLAFEIRASSTASMADVRVRVTLHDAVGTALLTCVTSSGLPVLAEREARWRLTIPATGLVPGTYRTTVSLVEEQGVVPYAHDVVEQAPSFEISAIGVEGPYLQSWKRSNFGVQLLQSATLEPA